MSSSRRRKTPYTRRIFLALTGVTALAALPLLTSWAQAGPAGASAAPTFTLSSAGPPSISVSPDTGLPQASGAVDAGGSTNVKTTVSLAGNNFASSDNGFAILECNDDPNQPVFFFFGVQEIPVACSIDAILASGSTPGAIPATYSVISGNVNPGGSTCTGGSWSPTLTKPPAGNTCDDAGNAPSVDAAKYPCPPTAAEQAAGDLCALVVAGLKGFSAQDLAAQPLEFTGEALPTMTVTGTAAATAYPGEIVQVAGSGWPITPTSGSAGATSSITGTMSVCNASGCMSTTQTATPPSVDNSTASLSGTMEIPAQASSGVTYPCTSGCYVELQGTEQISEEGLSASVSAIDSTPISVDPVNEPAPTVTGVSPATGVLAGGTSVTLTGTAFTGATEVDFCSQAAPPVCTPGTGLTVTDDDDLTVASPAGASGPVDVVVTNAVGKSTTSASDVFTYSSQAASAPTVSGISPSTGPASGGTTVTITGTGFAAGATVNFGSVAATGVTVTSSTSITCTSPAGSGTVDVTVAVAGSASAANASDLFSYSGGGPSAQSKVNITSISPDFGSSAGCTAGGSCTSSTGVVITGNGFFCGGSSSCVSALKFGSLSSPSVNVVSDTQIIATAPGQPDGTLVNVSVTTSQGTSPATSASTFFYVGSPTLDAVSPASGNASGGNCVTKTGYNGLGCVTLTGSDFNGTVEVQFGGVVAPAFDVVSNAEIIVSPPAGTAGTIDVRVSNVAGSSPSSSQTQYTYFGIPAPPTVTGVSPATGALSGGTQVTISGTNFVTGALVCFGYTTTDTLGNSTFTGSFVKTTAAGSTSGAGQGVVVSNDRISVTTPAGPAGQVEIVVLTAGGSSGSAPAVGPCKGTGAASPRDEFFYTSAAGIGYWMVAADGGVFTEGNVPFQGSLGGICTKVVVDGSCTDYPIVGMAAMPGSSGYWLVGSDGGVFTFDCYTARDCQSTNPPPCNTSCYFGSEGGKTLNAPIAGIASTPDGLGYWLVGRDGGVFTFGDAGYFGSEASVRLLTPVVGLTPTPDAKGYWIVDAGGGVHAFGDATYFGSRPSTSTAYPIVGLADTTDGGGYWLAATNGAVYAYGDAVNYGSTLQTLLAPVDAIIAASDGNGYWLFERNGAVLTFGDAPQYGSLCSSDVASSCIQLVRPVMGAAA